jgi:hypothetical protein
MIFKPSKINRFLLFQLPSAWLAGVRIKEISDSKAVATAKHKWINQNPFGSMYFAVLAMGAELSTGILVMKKIQESEKNISMLVTHNEADFTKKARGRINFICEDGKKIDQNLQHTINTGEGVQFDLISNGYDETGDLVCTFTFQWSMKLK